MQESDLPKNVSDTHKYKLLATTIMEQVETKQILDSHVDGDINLKQSSDNAPRSFGMRNMRLIGLGGISLMILGILAAGVLFLSGTLNQNNTTDAELITKALQNAQELNIADSNQ